MTVARPTARATLFVAISKGGSFKRAQRPVPHNRFAEGYDFVNLFNRFIARVQYHRVIGAIVGKPRFMGGVRAEVFGNDNIARQNDFAPRRFGHGSVSYGRFQTTRARTKTAPRGAPFAPRNVFAMPPPMTK